MTPSELAAELRARESERATWRVVTGFDGFVDEMIELVAQRHDLDRYNRVTSIPEFGKVVNDSSGHSSLHEIIIRRMDPGGCAVNMGDGLAELGVPVSTFATVGTPIHAAFQDYAIKSNLYSWGREPGRTLAFEFQDGKMMFSSVSPLADFTPEHVRSLLADSVFADSCAEASLIALTDWTLFPHMTACWQVIREEVFDKLSHRPTLFFDLVDPSSRSRVDIREMLEEIPRFSRTCRVTLGLNRKETRIVAESLELPFKVDATEELGPLAEAIRKRLAITEVVVHSRTSAWAAGENGCFRVDAPTCETPIKSTGAGDRFNSGYALGVMMNLQLEDRLRLATTCAGIYVRSARSPDFNELALGLETGLSNLVS